MDLKFSISMSRADRGPLTKYALHHNAIEYFMLRMGKIALNNSEWQ